MTAGLLIVFGIAAITGGMSLLDAFSTLVLPIVCFQGGYMLGLTGRDPLRQYVQKRASTHTEHV